MAKSEEKNMLCGLGWDIDLSDTAGIRIEIPSASPIKICYLATLRTTYLHLLYII